MQVLYNKGSLTRALYAIMIIDSLEFICTNIFYVKERRFMNKKKISFIVAMLCLTSVVIIICIKESGMVKKHRKLTIEDFEAVELGISEKDVKKQLGEPDDYLTKELGETNTIGVGNMVYVLEDGRTVVPFFWYSQLCSLVVYEDDHMAYTIKERWELAPDEIRVAGVDGKCPPEDRKLTIEDFDDVELWDTETDVVEKVGKPNFTTRNGLPGDPVYVLKDGRCVIAYYMHGYLYGLVVWKGDSRDCILKAIDESEVREVHYDGDDIRYITRHRNLTVEDFEDIELGVTLSDIEGKIGKADIWIWDKEIGVYNPLYVLEDERVVVCCLSGAEEDGYLKKIVVYNGDDIDHVVKELDE